MRPLDLSLVPVRLHSGCATIEKGSSAMRGLSERLPAAIEALRGAAGASPSVYSKEYLSIYISDVVEAIHMAVASGNLVSVEQTLVLVELGALKGIRKLSPPQTSRIVTMLCNSAIAILRYHGRPGIEEADEIRVMKLRDSVPVRLLGIAAATVIPGEASLYPVMINAIIEASEVCIEALGRARANASARTSRTPEDYKDRQPLTNAIKLYNVQQKISAVWSPSESGSDTASLAAAKDALLQAIATELGELSVREALRLSRTVLGDFDALCTAHGRTVAVFGVRKAATVISRFAVPVVSDAAVPSSAVDFLQKVAHGDAAGSESSSSDQIFECAMHRSTLEDATAVVAAAGRAVESRGQACGRSARLAAPRARLSHGAVKDLAGAMARPRKIVEEALRLVLVRAMGQDPEAQEAAASAGSSVALLLEKPFNVKVVQAMGRSYLAQILIAAEQIGGGVPVDAETLRDVADVIATGAGRGYHPLVDRAIAAAKANLKDGVDEHGDPISRTEVQKVIESLSTLPTGQADAADALRRLAMRMDLRSPTRSVLAASLLAASRTTGLEMIGSAAYVGAVRMATRAIGMASSDFGVAGYHLSHAVSTSERGSEALIESADEALVTLHSAVMDAKRAMEGVRVGLSVLRRAVASQEIGEAAQSMHAAFEAVRAAYSCDQAAKAVENSAESVGIRLQRATRGTVGRRRATIAELREGMEMVKGLMDRDLQSALEQVSATADNVVEAVRRNISSALAQAESEGELTAADAGELSRAILRLAQHSGPAAVPLVSAASRAFAVHLEGLVSEGSSASSQAQNTVYSMVRMYRSLLLLRLRNSKFDRATASAFIHVMAPGMADGVRPEDAVLVLYNLQQTGFGLLEQDRNAFGRVSAVLHRVGSSTAADVQETAQLWYEESQGGIPEDRLHDMRQELFRELVPAVYSLCLTAWCQAMVQEEISVEVVGAVERALGGLFSASRYISNEGGGQSSEPLTKVQSELIKALGTKTLVYLRQVQLTLEKLGTSSGLHQLSLPARMRFPVQHALTAEASPSSQYSQLQSDVLLSLKSRLGFKPFYREYLTDEELYVDAAWPDHMVCLEVDGPHHYLPVDIATIDSSGSGVSTDLTAPTRWKSRLLSSAGWDVRRVAFFEWTGSSPSDLKGSTEAETILSAAEQERLLGLRLPKDLVMTTEERAQSVLRYTYHHDQASKVVDADASARPERTDISEIQEGSAQDLMGGEPKARSDVGYSPEPVNESSKADEPGKAPAESQAFQELSAEYAAALRSMLRDAEQARTRGIDSATLQSNTIDAATFRIAGASSQTRARSDLRKLVGLPSEEDDVIHALLKVLSRRPGLIAPYREVLYQLNRMPLGHQAEARLEALLEFAEDADEQLYAAVMAVSAPLKNENLADDSGAAGGGRKPAAVVAKEAAARRRARREERLAQVHGRRRKVRPIKPSLFRRLKPRRMTGDQLTALAQRGLLSERIIRSLSKTQLGAIKPATIRDPVMRFRMLRAIGQAQARDESAYGSRKSDSRSAESFHDLLGKHAEEGRKMEQTLRAVELSRKSIESMWTRIPYRKLLYYQPRRRNERAIARAMVWRDAEPTVHIAHGRRTGISHSSQPEGSMATTKAILRGLSYAKGKTLVEPSRMALTPGTRRRVARLLRARSNLLRGIRKRTGRRRAARSALSGEAPAPSGFAQSDAAEVAMYAAASAELSVEDGSPLSKGGPSSMSASAAGAGAADEERRLEDLSMEMMRASLPSEVTDGAKTPQEVISRVQKRVRESRGRGRIRPFRSSRTVAEDEPSCQPPMTPTEYLRQDKLSLARSAIPDPEVLYQHVLSQPGNESISAGAAMDQLVDNEEALLTFADFLIESGAPGTEGLLERQQALGGEGVGAESSLEGLPSASPRLYSIVPKEEMEAAKQFATELRYWEEQRDLLRRRQAKGYDMKKQISPRPSLPEGFGSTSKRIRQARLSKLLGSSDGKRWNRRGPLESLAVARSMELEQRKLLRKAGTPLPPAIQARVDHLVETVGIPEDLARVTALDSPANDYERQMIQQVQEFEEEVEESGSPEAALAASGVPVEAIEEIRRAQELDQEADSAEDPNDKDGTRAWAREQALQASQQRIEEALGVGTGDVAAIGEQIQRMQAEGLTLDQAAEVVFSGNDFKSLAGESQTGSDQSSFQQRFTPRKARVYLAQVPDALKTADAVEDALNRKLVRAMLSRLGQVSVVEPAQVDLSNETVQRKLLARSDIQRAMMQLCAEFQHHHGEAGEEEGDALKEARAKVEEYRIKARQIRLEIESYGDTDGFGRSIASRGATTKPRQTKGRKLPLQFERKDVANSYAPQAQDRASGRSAATSEDLYSSDPFNVMSGLMQYMQAMEAHDGIDADEATMDIDRLAKEAEYRLKSGSMPGPMASVDEVSYAAREQEKLAHNARLTLERIGVDYDAFRRGDPAAIDMLTRAVAKAQEEGDEDLMGGDVAGSTAEVVRMLRGAVGEEDASFYQSEFGETSDHASIRPEEAMDGTQREVSVMLGRLNGPVEVLRQVTGKSYGDILVDAEWFASQTPQQLGLMQGRRVLSKRGIRALEYLLSATEGTVDAMASPSKSSPVRRGVPGKPKLRQAIRSKGQAQASGSQSRGRPRRRVFGESTRHLDAVVGRAEAQAGEAIAGVVPSGTGRRRHGLRGPQGRRKARTWDEEARGEAMDGVRQVGAASAVERRHDAVEAGANREFIRDMLDGSAVKSGEMPVDTYRDLQQQLRALGGASPDAMAEAAGFTRDQAAGLEQALMEAMNLDEGGSDDGKTGAGGRQ